jgi:NAD(P)-dependent dehydrogenase (short-subunit alcohol dehydrogenase family)
MREFDGKVAVVTGAASGIGLGLATRFAQERMKVVLADVEEEALEAAVTDLRRQELDVVGVLTDVSNEASVQSLAQQTLDAFGKVHVLCNNAGVAGAGGGPMAWDWTMKDWQWVFGVNFWGVVHGIRAFLPIMIAQDEEGHVVNTASMAGLLPGGGIYGVTKHAVVALSESLYTQLKVTNAKVGVSVLCPGFVHTNISDSERNRPAELSEATEEPLDATRQAMRDMIRQRIATGMEPMDVAGIVLEAIRSDQFWITTTDEFDAVVRARHDGILARSNPPLARPV